MTKAKEMKKQPTTAPLEMAFFDSIQLVPASWDELVGAASTYLTTGYLRAIEAAMKGQMTFRYILFSKAGQPVALAAFQLIKVDSRSLDIEQTKKRKKLMSKVLDQMEVTCLINGTLFGSGEHGFYYSPELEAEEAFKALADGTKRLCALEQKTNKVQVIMVKDYFPENSTASAQLENHKYRSFKMEPNLVLHIREEWSSMDDYLAAMTSKYRSATRGILKKSANLTTRDLTITEITKYQPELTTLFHAVHSKAKRKLGTLDVAAFVDLKRNLKSDFILRGYFLEEQLVGFASIIVNGEALDSNYVGLDYELNKPHNIYQRMLYDLVQMTFDKKLSKLHFGRTAGDIKSSFGGKAVDMTCYVKTTNSAFNKIIKPLVKRISTPDFSERNPFKV